MIPGLAFFESGMLRRKNSVSIITQTLGGLVVRNSVRIGFDRHGCARAAHTSSQLSCSPSQLLACLWVVIGYTLTFGRDAGGVIGGVRFRIRPQHGHKLRCAVAVACVRASLVALSQSAWYFCGLRRSWSTFSSSASRSTTAS
jgi:ammonia channel protein AmtB